VNGTVPSNRNVRTLADFIDNSCSIDLVDADPDGTVKDFRIIQYRYWHQVKINITRTQIIGKPALEKWVGKLTELVYELPENVSQALTEYVSSIQ